MFKFKIVNGVPTPIQKNKKTLYLVRGIAGSGKTTFCNKVLGVKPYEADDYFMVNGKYCYDHSKIKMAHYSCQERARKAMQMGNPKVAVANTFIKKGMLTPYIQMANLYGYQVQIKVMNGRYKNVHDVPEDVLERMKKDFQY